MAILKWLAIAVVSILLFPIVLFGGLAFLSWKKIKNSWLRYSLTASFAIITLITIPAWANQLSKSGGSHIPTHQNASPVTKATESVSSKTPTAPAPAQNATTDTAPEKTTALSTRTKTSGCLVSNHEPDSACSPGAIFATATKDQICVSGYSSSVRDVSESLKDQVYVEYGITSHTSGSYEIDHIVPLELGGSNDIANLFPEAARPTPGFHEKDKLEDYLHSLVCDGKIGLSLAQTQIAHDWLSLYTKYYGSSSPTTPQASYSPTPPPSSVSPSPAPTPAPTQSSGGFVKMSTSHICHAPGDAYYDRTIHYTAYPDMQSCIDAGGRPSER